MNRNKTDYYEIDLLRLAGALWKKLWLIVLVTLLCGALAFGYTFFLVTPLYKATAMMYVNNSAISVGSAKVSISAGDLAASQSLVDTYTVILKTRGTLNEVISRTVSYTHLRAHETGRNLVCRLLLEKKKKKIQANKSNEQKETNNR